MRLCSPVPLGIFIAIVVGINLLLYGRSRFLRRVGAVLSSVLGPCIVWGAEQILLLVMRGRLWMYEPSSGNTFIIDRDITLNQLLWIPLQDAGCYILLAAVALGLLVFFRHKTASQIESLYPGGAFARWLDFDRKTGKSGRVAYQVMVVLTVLLALPATGLGAYVTMYLLSMRGQAVLIKAWIDWTVFGVGTIFALVYYTVNSVIALQD